LKGEDLSADTLALFPSRLQIFRRRSTTLNGSRQLELWANSVPCFGWRFWCKALGSSCLCRRFSNGVWLLSSTDGVVVAQSKTFMQRRPLDCSRFRLGAFHAGASRKRTIIRFEVIPSGAILQGCWPARGSAICLRWRARDLCKGVFQLRAKRAYRHCNSGRNSSSYQGVFE
jgi:hypothetical protein